MANEKAKIIVGLLLLTGALAAKAAGPPSSEGQTARTDCYGDPLPAGAVARLGTIRFRHDHASLHLNPAFSRNGKMLVTAFNDIRFWDPATGKLLRVIRDCPVGKTGPFFTPDGRWLIGMDLEASRKAGHYCCMIRLWDAATGRPLRNIVTEGGPLACTPDGKQLVTEHQGVVFLWDIATGKRTTQLRGGHKQQVTDLVFTADGKGLVTFCVDHRVCRWDLSSGRLEKTVQLVVPRQEHYTCLSPDGQSLAVSVRRKGPVFLLDTTTGKERVRLQGALAQGGYALAFSPDGKMLATSQGGQAWEGQTEVALWDAGTGKLLRHFSMPVMAALHLCFAPDGRTLVTAGQRPLVQLWDVATGKPIHNWSAHTRPITALSFTPNGAALISGSYDGSVRLWDAQTGRHLRKLQGHPSGVIGLDVAHDGKSIVSCGWSDGIRLQNPEGREGRRTLTGRPPEEIGPVEHWLYPHDTVQAFGLSPDGKTAVTYDDKLKVGLFYHVWDLSTGKAILERRDPSKVIRSRTFSPDTRLVAQRVDENAGGPSGISGGGPPGLTRAVVEEVASGKQVAALELPKQSGSILRFTADSRSLLTSSFQSERRGDDWHYNNALHLWELASRKIRQTITWSGRGSFREAAFSPDGRTVATAHDGQAIQLWDLATGKELLRRDGFFSQVACLAFSPDGRSLASGHMDGTILVWNVEVMGGHPEAKPGQRRINDCWSDLAGDDAVKAYRAIDVLCAAARQSVPFLKAHLRPIAEVEAKHFARLIADLDDEHFSVRENASAELAKYGGQAEAALRKTLERKPSLETRRRIQAILEELNRPLSAEPLRQLRGVETLERIGTLPAQEVLQTLAEGAPEARLTREAKAALERLTHRSSIAP